MRAADGADARLREAEVPDLALADQVADGPGHLLDRHVGIDAVLVVEVDRLDAQPLQRALRHLANVLRPAVEPGLLSILVPLEGELGGDHDLSAERRECLAEELLVPERAVRLRGVEECDAALDGGADERDRLLPVGGRTVSEAQPHAAEAKRRHFQVS